MIENGSRLSFADEALPVLVVLERLGLEEFQGDETLELDVVRLVDDPHTALAEFLDDLVMRDCPSNHRLSTNAVWQGNRSERCNQAPLGVYDRPALEVPSDPTHHCLGETNSTDPHVPAVTRVAPTVYMLRRY